MRAEGKISKEEYQGFRKEIDNEIDMINKSLNERTTQSNDSDLKIDKIRSSLNDLVDINNPSIDHKLINRFVNSVVPIDDNTFEWYLNLNDERQSRIFSLLHRQ